MKDLTPISGLVYNEMHSYEVAIRWVDVQKKYFSCLLIVEFLIVVFFIFKKQNKHAN